MGEDKKEDTNATVPSDTQMVEEETKTETPSENEDEKDKDEEQA